MIFEMPQYLDIFYLIDNSSLGYFATLYSYDKTVHFCVPLDKGSSPLVHRNFFQVISVSPTN